MTTQHQNMRFPRLALAVSLLIIGCFIVHTLYREHGRIEQRERERLSAQATVIDKNLGHQLNGIYRALEGIRKERPLKNNRMDRVNIRLQALADAMPGVRTFVIVDAAGQIVACNREQVIGRNVRYRDYFQAAFNNPAPDTLHISSPYKTLLGTFVITTGITIPGPRGEFAGVVAASFDPEYFTILLGSVLYAPDMWAALAHGDGKLFLRVPETNALAGLDLAGSGTLFTRHMKSGRQATVFSGSVPPAGEQRLMAQRTIKPETVPMDKPLVVAVSRDMSALYADWRREAFGKGALFGVLVLAMTSALYFYQRRQREFETISARHLEELLLANESAAAANEAKSRFLATVAHEFRTPLSILASSTDILDRYGERLSREERTLQNDHIRTAARRMSDLVDSVLSCNRLAVPPTHGDPALLDVRKFICKLAKDVILVCSKGHEFKFTIADDCGTILLDEGLFRRIAENLLTNAFRYTPSDGAVTLHVSRERDRLQIVIADSGIGIPEEDQKHIFEAFYRCPNVESRAGLGLGLSIVQDALLHVGGIITVDSTMGKGTTMRVEIPLASLSDPEELPLCTQS